MTRTMELLGMNRRNACYILPNNSRKDYPLVDDKLLTKNLLEAHGIPTPKLYFKITHTSELKTLRKMGRFKEFVIKPASGAEGRGVLVILNRVGNKWQNAKGEFLSLEDIAYHISNILAGLFSLGGMSDKAICEYYVNCPAIFDPISYRGVPDIRVVMYRGIPVMAMLRLPTKQSGGRANLHQGAIGAGINILNGLTIGGVHKNKLIETHPDTQVPIRGFEIPYWKDILDIAIRTHPIFGLGYVGIDFVIDADHGPMILELNARPGLNIQLANRAGLRPRLEWIDKHSQEPATLSFDDRLALSESMIRACTTNGNK
ncbi:MAG: alpha-L-glutamate ligase-like protein [Chlamydiota bacterium]|nr:alpha-L-glutamate ligase-like protein [Chlamydiota bacterium]